MDDSYKNNTDKVSQHWGSCLPDLSKCFYGFPPIRDYLFHCISGRTATKRNSFEEWIVKTYLGDKIPVAECLSICCGFGEIERILAEIGTFRHCTGIDLSPEAIKSAQEKAKDAGLYHIDYQVADLNILETKQENYDLIWANGALHHISNLEHIISQIYKSLKPGGIFTCNEYIGPKHQKLSFRQREIVNSVIHLIPPRLRARDEKAFVPVYFRNNLWRRLLYELYRLVTFQEGSINIDYIPKSEMSGHKAQLLQLYRAIREKVPVVKTNSFQYGKVWDETSQLIKSTDPSECVRSDEIIPLLKQTFKKIDVRYYNGSILLYALDKKFFNEYDPNRKEDKILLDLLINIEKVMIEAGELSSDHTVVIAQK